MSTTDDVTGDTTPDHGGAPGPAPDSPHPDSGPTDATAPQGGGAHGADSEIPDHGPHDDDTSRSARPGASRTGQDARDTGEPRDTAGARADSEGRSRPRAHGNEDTEDTEDTEAAREFIDIQGSVSGSAVTAGGQGNTAVTVNLGANRRIVLQRMPLDATVTDRFLHLHQKVPAQDQLTAGLLRDHLAVLIGRDGSGRESLARVGLAKQCGSQQLSRLYSAEDGLPQALIAQARRYFEPGHGVLVDLGTRRPGQDTLAALSERARRHEAYVVLIVDEPRSAPGDPGPYDVRHQPPELRPVLEAHLDSALVEHRSRCTGEDRCDNAGLRNFRARLLDDPRVESELATALSVRYVADFARNLASCLHQPPEALAPLFGGLPSLARRVLQMPETQMPETGLDGQPSVQSPDPYHRPLRIAYVLCHGLPLSDAIRTGALLSDEVLRAEQRETTPTRPVFDLDLDDLVGPGIGIAAATADQEPDNPRRARLAHKGLVAALVEAIWHGPAGLRDPLVEWLRKLAEDDLERVRIRAAEIAGLLLRHDFDGAYRNLVGPWARGVVRYRRLAAVALTVAVTPDETRSPAEDPRLTAQVRRQVADWARSPGPRLQDSAARAYGTRVGTQDVATALGALRELGTRPGLVPFASIASSTAALYLADDGAEPVVRELGHWMRSYNDFLPRHAVRTLLGLGLIAIGPDLPAWPTLAYRAIENPEHEETLLLLWQRALVDPAHSGQAWELLRQWLLAADQDDELARFLQKFVMRVWEPKLLHRAGFNLRRWVRQQPTANCLRCLLDELGRG